MLLRLTDINKFYNGSPVLQHVHLTIEDRDRIGLIGVNGCGKSTLLKIITGSVLPDHILEQDGEIAKSTKPPLVIWNRWVVWTRKIPSGKKCAVSFVRF